MHILMVSEYFPPHAMGGGELSAFALAKALVRKGIEVSVLTSKFADDVAQESMEGVAIYRRLATGENASTVGGNLKRFQLTSSIVKELPKLVDEIKPDIIHAMNITSMAGVADAQLGVPAIAHINSPLAFDPKGTLLDNGKERTKPYTFRSFVESFLSAKELGTPWFVKYNPVAWFLLYDRWAAIRVSFTFFRHFFPISTAMQEWLVKYKVPKEKTTVTYNLIPLDKFKEAKPAKNKIPKIICLSGYVRFKGLHIVLDALKGVSEKYELQCFGKGTDKQLLQQQAKASKINAKFNDEVPSDKLPELIAKHDILVFPSQVPEGLGRVAIEAMAAGKPVIASDIGGMKDTVVDKKTGFLVKPDDVNAWRSAIITLLKDAKKRESFGTAGQKRVFTEFTEEKILGKVIDAYKKVLG